MSDGTFASSSEEKDEGEGMATLDTEVDSNTDEPAVPVGRMRLSEGSKADGTTRGQQAELPKMKRDPKFISQIVFGGFICLLSFVCIFIGIVMISVGASCGADESVCGNHQATAVLLLLGLIFLGVSMLVIVVAIIQTAAGMGICGVVTFDEEEGTLHPIGV